MGTETVTVLRCAANLRLAKLIRASGEVVPYDSARTFDAAEVRVQDLSALHRVLVDLQAKPRCAVVRGALIDGPRAEHIQRRLYDDRETGECATLRDVPRRWLALDMEGIDLPGDVRADDIAACARIAIATLLPAFGGTACIAQATAGHALKPGIRLRLWYWLDRAVSGGELKWWLRSTPADPAVFRAAQVIYTAAPVFEGTRDHLPARIVCMPGAAEVAVPPAECLAPPPPRPAKPIPLPTDTRAARYAASALMRSVAEVARAPVNSRHDTCVHAARSLARLVEAGLLTRDQVAAALGGALEQAGKDRQEAELIAAWSFKHPSAALLPEGLR